MLRLTLLVSSVFSFLYFLNPSSFSFLENTKDKVLSIDTFEQSVNFSVVEKAVNIYCLNNLKLPPNLNVLYQDELSRQRSLDLDQLYFLEKGKDCEFTLKKKGV